VWNFQYTAGGGDELLFGRGIDPCRAISFPLKKKFNSLYLNSTVAPQDGANK